MAVLGGSVFPSLQASAAESPTGTVPGIEELLVSADSTLADRLGAAGSITAIESEELRLIGATHISEALARVPGVWVARGSGQEHLTAIRSAVLTGAGACGEFLFLEDGLPIRPAGFCNVNGLFEVNSEQPGRIEVWRGPASALLGGNALHGAVNFVTDIPTANTFSAEGGPYDYYRLSGQFHQELNGHEFGVSINGNSSNGYRDFTGYDQQKASLVHSTDVGAWSVYNTLHFTNLNQETGAFVEGFEVYKDDDLRKTNPAPEAYRDAKSARLASFWTKDAWRITPYLRWSDMNFLQHFLPGEPRERNDQTSGGVLLGYDFPASGRLRASAGAHLELMSSHLDEYQDEPLTTSSAFNNAVRPQGWHYDYDTDSMMAAGFYDLSWSFTEETRLVHSLRIEYLEYDYSNRILDGNTRDDGTACGFGGCLYNRPADRTDDYTNVAGRIGIEQDFSTGMAYLVIGNGFRPPQVTELYRLQRGQDVADLKSEELWSVEAGFKGGFFNVALFSERTDNYIFRDSAGLNVSDGRTKAWGVEFEAFRSFGDHTLSVSGTYAEHKYDFDRDATGGEVIEKNNYIDTAPKWLANARWNYAVTDSLGLELEAEFVDKHYINADNTAEYDGHLVFHLRGRYAVNDRLSVFGRVINLLDDEYAERGDYTVFSPLNYRYFPAMPRQIYAGVTIDL
ncbi:MAG: TonB-dependent receptor [Pseudomonadales bacterium]